MGNRNIKRLMSGVLIPLIPGLVIVIFLRLAGSVDSGVVVDAQQGVRPALVREPVTAGQFYPDEPGALRRRIREMLADNKPEAKSPPSNNDLVGIIVPHAGLDFSGPVAAAAFARLKGTSFDTVVVVGPSHHVNYEGAAVYDGDYYRTPLGKVPIDTDVVKKLVSLSPKIRPLPEAEAKEHSVEVEAPWLQETVGRFKMVSLIVGEETPANADMVGKSLAAALVGRRALIVASVDLSHYYPAEKATTLDRVTANAVSKMDEKALFESVAAGATEPDAPAVIGAALIAAKRLAAEEARVFKLGNSGDTTGEKQKVVGYMAAGLYRRPIAGGLSDKDKQTLLRLARQAIVDTAKNGKMSADAPKSRRLLEPGMAFVTIKENGFLRGCVGFTEATQPLYQAVRRAAVGAAFNDERFERVTVEETNRLELEISVVKAGSAVGGIENIKIGRDGLTLTKDANRGVFLPQIPVEFSWDTTTYLEELSAKAGLDRQAWRADGTMLGKFEAEVFAE